MENRPWYPSLAAFEHHDSGRSHLFPDAVFGGDERGPNVVTATSSSATSGPTGTTGTTAPSGAGLYPSGWNMTYLDADNAFLFGGGDGNQPTTTGAYVAKVHPQTLQPVWKRQLIDTKQNGEWDYPGTLALGEDRMLYAIYGYRLAKIDPDSGDVVATLELPTGGAAPGDTSYNGFSGTPGGLIVAKSIYRQAGCTIQGPNALLQCPDPSAVPATVLSTIDMRSMTVRSTVTMPEFVIGRATVGHHQGRDYAYFFTQTNGFIRYEVANDGTLTLDETWKTGPLLQPGQTTGWAAVVIGDWVITQCNGLPASAPLSVYAVNQADASKRFTTQPFADDPIPPEVRAAYSKQAPGGTQAVSFIPSTMSGDPDTKLIYAMDAVPGKVAGIRITEQGLETVWKVDQVTTEFIAVIGPPDQRTIVGTDVPGEELPGRNTHDEVVWRNAGTGAELARSERLPAMTPATMVQPYYLGEVFYPGLDGTLYRLRPARR